MAHAGHKLSPACSCTASCTHPISYDSSSSLLELAALMLQLPMSSGQTVILHNPLHPVFSRHLLPSSPAASVRVPVVACSSSALMLRPPLCTLCLRWACTAICRLCSWIKLQLRKLRHAVSLHSNRACNSMRTRLLCVSCLQPLLNRIGCLPLSHLPGPLCVHHSRLCCWPLVLQHWCPDFDEPARMAGTKAD